MSQARVCRDLESLGVSAQRVPYGLDSRAWGAAIDAFGARAE
jgi:hypothetical protein